MSLCPSEGDRPAPVVGDRDRRAGDAERVAQPPEVVDAGREPSERAGSFGEPHVEVVDRDHPEVGGGVPEKVAEQERPRRVAVHAQQRQPGLSGRRGAVQDVPGAVDAVAVDGGDETRPPRVEPDEPGRRERRRFGVAHQRSSMTPAFKPEPMPMHSTESPSRNVCWPWASVIGIAAGPMLP